MKVIKGDDFSYFDVDDTLVSWAKYPHMQEDSVLFEDPFCPGLFPLSPIKKTIESLKAGKEAGSTIVVWSAGGWEWALEVVTKLELQDYVDVVMSKPSRYYDDLPSGEFMGTRYDFSKELK